MRKQLQLSGAFTLAVAIPDATADLLLLLVLQGSPESA
jgi:hypothetical protein